MQPNQRLDAIAEHASLLLRDAGASRRSAAYADLCAKRQIEIREQELRAHVVRRSVRRIDCIAGAAALLIAIGCFGALPVRFGYFFLASIPFAGVLISASTKSIAAAFQRLPVERIKSPDEDRKSRRALHPLHRGVQDTFFSGRKASNAILAGTAMRSK